MPLNRTISILSDNRTADPQRFQCEHGLSVLLQTPSAKILMDTGASGLFAANAAQMGIDLSDVDYVFLSHGHYDHTGGLKTFLDLNIKAKIIVSRGAVSGQFCSERGGLHSISSDWPLDQMQGRTIYVEDTMALAEGIHIIARIPGTHPRPMGNRLLSVRSDEGQAPDDFSHEIALYADGLLYTGCAHNGLENILEACPWPVDTVIGGFHLLDSDARHQYESDEQLAALAGRLAHRCPQVSYYTGHCTGDNAFRILQSVLGSSLQQFFCGQQIVIDLHQRVNNMKKIVIIDGGPRPNMNTAQILRKFAEGAQSVSEDIEVKTVRLYDLDYKGCMSCMACKVKGKASNICRFKDPLTPILEEIAQADGLVLGSPVYFGDVTGQMRTFLERLCFPWLSYNDYSLTAPKRMPVVLIETMNGTPERNNSNGYGSMEHCIAAALGTPERLIAYNTYQVKNYDRFELAGFSEEAKRNWRDKHWEEDLQKAFDAGRKMAGSVK